MTAAFLRSIRLHASITDQQDNDAIVTCLGKSIIHLFAVNMESTTDIMRQFAMCFSGSSLSISIWLSKRSQAWECKVRRLLARVNISLADFEPVSRTPWKRYSHASTKAPCVPRSSLPSFANTAGIHLQRHHRYLQDLILSLPSPKMQSPVASTLRLNIMSHSPTTITDKALAEFSHQAIKAPWCHLIISWPQLQEICSFAIWGSFTHS